MALVMNSFFLRKLSSLYLKKYNPESWRPWGKYIFYIDTNNFLDIIDYWNLRAIGRDVFPIPKQASKFDNVKELLVDIIEENFYPDRFNPNIYHSITFIKSRSISMNELEEFIKSLNISPSKQTNKHKFGIQHWYPRIWDEWARKYDGVEYCEINEQKRDKLHLPSELDNFSSSGILVYGSAVRSEGLIAVSLEQILSCRLDQRSVLKGQANCWNDCGDQ